VRPAQVHSLRSIPVYGDARDPNSVAPPGALPPGLSGIAIDGGGYVLTSANVGKLAAPVQIIFANGEQRDAEIAAADANEFVALLKLSSPPAANIASPRLAERRYDLPAGSWLVRHGRSPSGRASVSLCLLESVRLGAKDTIIGLLDRDGVAEVDGAALVDVTGRLVGMYVAPGETPAFVIPIGRALDIANRLKNVPRAPQSWVGLELQDLSDDLREYFAVPAGVLITEVRPESPAAAAGLRPADIVQKLDDVDVESAPALMAALASKPAESEIRLGIRRGSRSMAVKVITGPGNAGIADAGGEPVLRLRLDDSISANASAIAEVGPPDLASRLGLRAGDIIQSFNGRPIRRSLDLVQLVRTAPAGKANLYQVRRGERVFFIAIKERVNVDE
jgi:serine protease Do